jgi:hypothetical protein
MVPNVFIIIKKTHAVLAIKGEKKDETRGEEVRGRGGRKKEKRGENETAETKKQWEESVKKREAEGVSRIREKQRGGETNRGTEDRQKTQHQQRS